MNHFRGERIKVNGKPARFRGYIGSAYYSTSEGRIKRKDLDEDTYL